MSRLPIIAIDGPAGAGKGTTARLLAEKLGLTFIDTGAMYRGVALFALRAGLDWYDNDAVGELAQTLNFHFEMHGDKQHTVVNGEDVTMEIRQPNISQGASAVATLPKVVDALIEKQREMGKDGGIVMEGRQIGTLVFPNADLKIFLTASPEERARRRLADHAKRGEHVSYEDLLKQIHERDHQDTNRPYAALKKAEGAVEILTDSLSPQEVVDHIASLVSRIS